MRAAIIKDDVVENVINLPDDWTGAQGEWQPKSGREVDDVTDKACGKEWTRNGDGSYTRPPSDEPEPTLAEVEAECLERIDRKASRVRERFITSGTGQSAVYITKYEEARAYKAASSPTDSDYPYLAMESDRRGVTVANLADEVIATRNGWTDPAGATIEAERVGGKQDVRAASDADSKRSAANSAIATLDDIKP